ncbi:MAG: PAS domain S-box protein [Magnetococcales bacterium]|nr:PAS domain S-box protein [Magnetococcales bacterium]
MSGVVVGWFSRGGADVSWPSKPHPLSMQGVVPLSFSLTVNDDRRTEDPDIGCVMPSIVTTVPPGEEDSPHVSEPDSTSEDLVLIQRRILLGLTLLGVVTNLFSPSLSFGIDLVFGGTFGLVAARIFGIRRAFFTIVTIHGSMLFMWGEPYSALLLTIESITIIHLATRGDQELYVLDGLFWLALGVPLGMVVFDVALNLDPNQLWLILLVLPVNGLICAILADFILSSTQVWRVIGCSSRITEKGVSLRRSFMRWLIVFVLVPLMAHYFLESMELMEESEKSMEIIMTDFSGAPDEGSEEVMGSWLSHGRILPFSHHRELLNTMVLCHPEQTDQKQVVPLFPLQKSHEQLSEYCRDWHPSQDDRLLSNGIIHALPPSSSGSNLQRWRDSVYIRDHRVENNAHNGRLNPHDDQEHTSQGNRVRVIIRAAPLAEMMYHTYTLSFAYILIMSVLAAVAGWVVSGRVVEDVTHLGQSSKTFQDAITRGESIQVPRVDVAELQDVAVNFQTMADTLSIKFGELDRRNRQLQEEVRRRNRIQGALKASERKLRSLVDNSPDVIQLVDEDGQIQFINESNQPALSGLSVDRSHELLSAEGQQRFRQALKRVFKHHQMERFEVGGSYSTWWVVRVIPLDEDGQVTSAMVMFSDITQRKEAEIFLARSEQRYRMLVDTMNEGVIINDYTDHIIYLNERSCTIFGQDRNTMLLTNCRALFGRALLPASAVNGGQTPLENPEEALSTSNEADLKEPDHAEWETSIRRPSGEEVHIRVAPRRLYDSEGRVQGSFAIITDITERRRFESELIDSREHLRKLTRHLHSIREQEQKRISREIHDELGSILTAMKLHVSTLHQMVEVKGLERENPLQDMADLVDRGVRTVRRIAMTLRPKILDQFGLFAGIEWLAHDFEKVMHIPCSIHPESHTVRTAEYRETQLFRVCQEALTNVMRHAQASRVELELRLESKVLIMRVRDDGIGFNPQEAMAGSSLGIQGMVERVRSLDGDIQIFSNQNNQGTLLEVRIPRLADDRVEVA